MSSVGVIVTTAGLFVAFVAFLALRWAIRRLRLRSFSEAPTVIDERRTPAQLAAELEQHRAAELQQEIRETLRQEHDDPEDRAKLAEAYAAAEIDERQTTNESVTSQAGSAGGNLTISAGTGGGGNVTLTGGTGRSAGGSMGFPVVAIPTPGPVGGRPAKQPLWWRLIKRHGRREVSVMSGEARQVTVSAQRQLTEEELSPRRHLFELWVSDQVREVCLAGEWNGWKPERMAVAHGERIEHGGRQVRWALERALPRYHDLQYKFVVDGEWITDPANPDRTVCEPVNSILWGERTPDLRVDELVWQGGDVLQAAIPHALGCLPQGHHFYLYAISVLPEGWAAGKLRYDLGREVEQAVNEGRLELSFAQTRLLDVPLRLLAREPGSPPFDCCVNGRPISIEALQSFDVRLRDLPEKGELRFLVALHGVLVRAIS